MHLAVLLLTEFFARSAGLACLAVADEEVCVCMHVAGCDVSDCYRLHWIRVRGFPSPDALRQ